jgi:hypothetical protein
MVADSPGCTASRRTVSLKCPVAINLGQGSEIEVSQDVEEGSWGRQVPLAGAPSGGIVVRLADGYRDYYFLDGTSSDFRGAPLESWGRESQAVRFPQMRRQLWSLPGCRRTQQRRSTRLCAFRGRRPRMPDLFLIRRLASWPEWAVTCTDSP